jgi:hypothetical protein
VTEPDLKLLWQDQPTEYDPMTLEHVRAKANAFQKKIRRRNLVEYLAMPVVVLGFSPLLFATHSWMMQLGGALIILATGYIGWQLHRRASARAAPESGAALVDFHRGELVRQQKAVRSAGSWYLAPLIPGMVMMTLGRWFQSPAAGRTTETDHVIIVLCSIIVALAFLAVWLVNRLGAHRLQKEIDELDALRRG